MSGFSVQAIGQARTSSAFRRLSRGFPREGKRAVQAATNAARSRFIQLAGTGKGGVTTNLKTSRIRGTAGGPNQRPLVGKAFATSNYEGRFSIKHILPRAQHFAGFSVTQRGKRVARVAARFWKSGIRSKLWAFPITRGTAEIWVWRSNRKKAPGAGNPKYKYALGAFLGPSVVNIWNEAKSIRNATKARGQEVLNRETLTRVTRLFRGAI